MNSLDQLDERVRLVVEHAKTSFWIIPAVLITFAGIMAVINLWLDVFVFPKVDFSTLFWMDPSRTEGIRTLLATTAGAILGVAGVSFSITIASLTLASQQFGPRLIRNFIQDRFTQTVLGFFVATFFYCMLTLQLSSVIVESTYTPVSTVITVLVLTVSDLLLLVLFIHHICVSIQVETVISTVAEEMKLRADYLFSSDIDKQAIDDQADIKKLEDKIASEGIPVCSQLDGYIHAINYTVLEEYAQKNDILIQLFHRAGDYVIARSALSSVIGNSLPDNLADVINKNIMIGKRRSPQQDLEYSIRQLVEIALRALSPGINDPFTAITCINRLGTLINMISTRAIQPRIRRSAEGEIRLLVDTTTFGGIVEAAFNQIRQASISHVDVTIRLLEIMRDVVQLARRDEQAIALSQQADLILAGVNASGFQPDDKKTIQKRYEALQNALTDNFPAVRQLQ